MLLLKSRDEQLSQTAEKNIRRLEDYRKKISDLDGEIVADVAAQIRGWEGQSSKIYFSTVNLFIPEKYRFENRSQHPATDIANALLNYGYGLLYSKIEGALIKAGIDPYIGVMHRDDYNRPVLVYDVIELYRVWVDYVVFSLLSQSVITEDYYSVRDDGSFWLEELGRRVLIQSLNDYLEETVTQKGITRSRYTQMTLYIQDLAQTFKKYEFRTITSTKKSFRPIPMFTLKFNNSEPYTTSTRKRTPRRKKFCRILRAEFLSLNTVWATIFHKFRILLLTSTIFRKKVWTSAC